MTHDTSKMVSLKIAYFAGLCLEAVNFFSFLEAVKFQKDFFFSQGMVTEMVGTCLP
jgi:hypothetical protein